MVVDCLICFLSIVIYSVVGSALHSFVVEVVVSVRCAYLLGYSFESVVITTVDIRFRLFESVDSNWRYVCFPLFESLILTGDTFVFGRLNPLILTDDKCCFRLTCSLSCNTGYLNRLFESVILTFSSSQTPPWWCRFLGIGRSRFLYSFVIAGGCDTPLYTFV